MSTDLISQDYDYLFKVLLLGDSDVGKSSLILRYTEETFNSKLVNSIGVDFKMKKKRDWRKSNKSSNMGYSGAWTVPFYHI